MTLEQLKHRARRAAILYRMRGGNIDVDLRRPGIRVAAPGRPEIEITGQEAQELLREVPRGVPAEHYVAWLALDW